MKKKLYRHLLISTLSILWLFFLLLSFSAAAQEQDRCQNNKNRLAELEKQLANVNAELSKIPEFKEIENARNHMVFVNKLAKKDSFEYAEYAELKRIASLYNFDFQECYQDCEESSPLPAIEIMAACAKVCRVNLSILITKKIDKAEASLPQKIELLKEKSDLEKQIAVHRNNIIALGCDKIDNTLTGTWKAMNWVYEMTQSGNTFSWKITNDVAYNESAKGTILDGNKIKATWTNKNGTDSGTGDIITDSNGKAIEIRWKNGVVFRRN